MSDFDLASSSKSVSVTGVPRRSMNVSDWDRANRANAATLIGLGQSRISALNSGNWETDRARAAGKLPVAALVAVPCR